MLKTLFAYVGLVINKMYMNLPETTWGSKRGKMIDSKYLPHHPKGIKTCSDAKELKETLPSIMKILGVHIGLNSVLFRQLLSIVDHYMI